MSARVIGSPFNKPERQVISVDANYLASNSDDELLVTTAGVTVTLPVNPQIGSLLTIVSDGANVTVVGGTFPFKTGGNRTMLPNQVLTLFFSTTNSWVEAGDAADPGSLTVQNWFIDPVAGSDLFDGLTAATAFKTMAHLAALWGFNILNPGAGLTVQVNLLNNLPASDPLSFELLGLGPSVCLFFQGIATTLAGPDVFSAVGFTPKVRATNTPLQLSGTAIASFAPFLPGGATPARVRKTSGTATEQCIFWPAKNTAGLGRMSEPFKPQTPVASNYPSLNNAARPSVAPAPGDTFVMESLTQVFFGECAIAGTDNGGTGQSGQNKVAFQNLSFQPPNNGARTILSIAGYVQVKFYECFQSETISVTGPGVEELWLNCALQRNLTGVGNTGTIQGGVVTGQTQFTADLIFLDLDVMFQGVGFGTFTNTIKIGTACFFDAGGGPNNPPGSGLHVMPGSAVNNLIFSDNASQIWGSGNTGQGISVAPGGCFDYATTPAGSVAPSITGSVPGVNDFNVGGLYPGSTAAAPVLFPVNPATGLPAAAPIACSWANLVAAYGGGTGFGGSATNHVKGGWLSQGNA